MSDILISIKPKWCDLIFLGYKTDEIRKTKPKEAELPYTVYVWQTGNGGVVGRFTVTKFTCIHAWKDTDGFENIEHTGVLRHCIEDSCELFDYLYRQDMLVSHGWAWRIENPFRFEKPLDLDYFGLKRPPQSWQYVNPI